MFSQLDTRRQAKADYEQARGTAHKLLLQDAKKILIQSKKKIEDKLKESKTRQSLLNAKRQSTLLQALETHLARTRLQEVPGIGEQRQSAILQIAFKGSLSDLKYAGQVPGIGEQTQRAINQWVDAIKRQIPQLLQEDFPGKHKIELKHQQQMQEMTKAISEYSRKKQRFEMYLRRIDIELAWLESVKIKDFKQALKTNQSTEKLDRYIQGVFAEWEAVPDWFGALMQLNASVPLETSKKKSDRANIKIIEKKLRENKSRRNRRRVLLILLGLAIMLFLCLCFLILIVSSPKGVQSALHDGLVVKILGILCLSQASNPIGLR